MRRKIRVKKASKGGLEENPPTCLETREKTLLGGTKHQVNPSKNPAGRGLGKAGAKRLGRLLKRVIQPQEEPAGKGKATLPKTPVRLFKHQIQKKANNAPGPETCKRQVSKLILSVVSQCKHRGGISMAELKQTLAAEGCDVAKNNRQVTERLVNDETLVRTTRNTSFRLNKKVLEKRTVNMNKATYQKPTRKLSRQMAAKKTPEEATMGQKNNNKTHKQKEKKKASIAAGKSQKTREKASNPRGKPLKPAKRPQTAKTRTTTAQKTPAKAKSKQKRQSKQVKTSQRRQPQRRRLPKTNSRLQTKQNLNTARTKKR